MVDAIISVVVDQVLSNIAKQTQNQITLVKGVDVELLSLNQKFQAIQNILNDAENRRFNDRNVNKWLSELEETCNEMEDILDEWNYALLKFMIDDNKPKVCSPSITSCLPFNIRKFVVRQDIANKINNTKVRLDEIFNEKEQLKFVVSARSSYLPSWQKVQSTSLINLEEVEGRNSDREKLVSEITSNEVESILGGLRVVSVVGVGGLGKTTLAQLVFNDDRVKVHFDLSLWICVSDPFDENQIAKEIIGSRNIDTKQLDVLVKQVQQIISGKKFLLVLDDVWNEDVRKWEALRGSLMNNVESSSTVIVTTRKETVAIMMGTANKDIYGLKNLSDDDCYKVLCRAANVSGREEVQSEGFIIVGKRIANKCNGLPLMAKILGGLLLYKNKLDEWNNMLNNEIWTLEVAQNQLFPHLLLSYNELPSKHKRCFSFCAVFPKGSVMDVQNLIDYCMVLGYLGPSSSDQDMEIKGQDIFNILAMHSLLIKICNEDRVYYKMHDIVHDFALFLRKKGKDNEILLETPTTCQTCSDSLLSNHVKEYRSLFWNKQRPPVLCNCLTSLRVLRIKNCNVGSRNIPQEMKNLIHLRWLDLSYNNLSSTDLKPIFQLYNLQFVYFVMCDLIEIPTEIGDLTNLRVLDLGGNFSLKKLPESICRLLALRMLSIKNCRNLQRLPEGIHDLINLKYLDNGKSTRFPNGLADLTGLCGMEGFYGGKGWDKLELLKNLNKLSGRFMLSIYLNNDQELVGDAQNAQLWEKKLIDDLNIVFYDIITEEESAMRMYVINALRPHPNLQKLKISGYMGSRFAPGWLETLELLRFIELSDMDHVLSLPPLWKHSCLEEINIRNILGLKIVGREFLGITTTGGGRDNMTGFPKLKKLNFSYCYEWGEWEDIQEEIEGHVAISLMPCLTELTVTNCPSLMALPHRLLCQAPSLETLSIGESNKLMQLYKDENNSPLRPLSKLKIN